MSHPSVDLKVVNGREGRDAVGVLELSGDFDIANAVRIDEAVSKAVGAGVRDFAVDLTRVSFFDAAALNALLLARKRSARRNGRLVLVRPGPMVWRVFSVTGLSHTFQAFASAREALDYLEGLDTSGAREPVR